MIRHLKGHFAKGPLEAQQFEASNHHSESTQCRERLGDMQMLTWIIPSPY